MDIETLKREISKHAEHLKQQGVVSLKVFGSVARGQSHPQSDVDLLVEFDGRPIGLFEFIALKHFLEKSLNVKVDLVTPRALKKQLKEQIQKEAIRVA